MFSDHHLDTLRTIVSAAGVAEIMPRFRSLGAADISEKKSAIDLVTNADLMAERQITDALRALFPEALVVGEEAAETDPGMIAALRGADLAFVIDPVDGTFNFAAGLPVFGTNLAVVVRGETVAGLIHEPVLGATLIAAKGAGARVISADGVEKPLCVAPPAPLAAMVGTISINDIGQDRRARIAANLARIRMAFAYNCSAYEYWMVATGKVHFIGHFKLMPWDHLAGVLIHEEAGGHTARFDGTPYRPGDTDGGILSAPDRESWNEILAQIVLA
jgi:fructose-1,6-bisphosphatase/inositol monophosphatase family enzyme